MKWLRVTKLREAACEDIIYWFTAKAGNLPYLEAYWIGGPSMTTTNPEDMGIFVKDVERAYWQDQEHQAYARAAVGSPSSSPTTGDSGLKHALRVSSSQPLGKQAADGDQRTRSLSWLGQDEINTLVQNVEKES